MEDNHQPPPVADEPVQENKGSEREPFHENPPSRDYARAPEQPPTGDGEGRKLVVRKMQYELPEGKKALPSRNPAHTTVLFHLTHEKQRPRNPCPGFRLLGAFPSQDAMKDFISRNYDTERDECSLWCAPLHHLVPICLNKERQMDTAYCSEQVKQLVDLYQTAVQAGQQRFTDAVDQKTDEKEATGRTTASIFAREQVIHKQGPRAADENMVVLPKTGVLSNQVVVLNQRFAVVFVLRDLRDAVIKKIFPPEPAFSVLAVFEKEEDASFYAKFTATRDYPLCAIDVIDMYEWMFPENINTDEIKEAYADPALDDIMAGRKDAMSNAEKYESWCKSTKNTPEMTEVGGERKDQATEAEASAGETETNGTAERNQEATSDPILTSSSTEDGRGTTSD